MLFWVVAMHVSCTGMDFMNGAEKLCTQIVGSEHHDTLEACRNEISSIPDKYVVTVPMSDVYCRMEIGR